MRSKAGRWMGWCVAVILAAFAAAERTCAGTDDVGPSNETLAQLFADLATGREFERAGHTLRWERPIRYAVMSREPSDVAERAPRVLGEFAAIAGVPVEASEILPWDDPSVIPENTFATEDGFRGHIQRVRGKDVDDDPHFVATWGRGDDLVRADATLIMLVDDRETLVAQLAGGDRHTEARRQDLAQRRLDCLFFLHENRRSHIVLGLVLLNTSLDPLKERACINEELFQIFGLLNDVSESPLTMLDQGGYSETSTPTEYDRMLLRLLYHPRMETGLDHYWARHRAMKLLPELRGRCARGGEAAGGFRASRTPKSDAVSAGRHEIAEALASGLHAGDRRQRAGR